MGLPNDPNLGEPCISDKLLEIRVGQMKRMEGLTVDSGIDKTCVSQPIRVSFLGLEGDEHDPTFHGGIDKAVHGC
jgi:MOSC domain-containing protein YiiM